MDVPFPQGSLRSPWATARRPPGSNLAGVDPPEHSVDKGGTNTPALGCRPTAGEKCGLGRPAGSRPESCGSVAYGSGKDPQTSTIHIPRRSLPVTAPLSCRELRHPAPDVCQGENREDHQG